MANTFDAIIVGAGPAGAWTAYLLASRGARIALLDPSHPREKPCGGGVTARALALVGDAIGGDFPAVDIRVARFVDTATGRSASIALDAEANRSLVVASRSSFDGLLLEAARRAGAEWLATRVTGVARAGANWHITTADGRRVESPALIGADGANSLVRRRVARAFRRDQLSIATGFFARGATSSEIVVEFTADPPGYIWSFPRSDHLAVGICSQADSGVTAGALRSRVARWLDQNGIGAGAPLEPYAWPIPSLSTSDLATLDVAGPGWMLVGDAAGLVDPITREGIFFALQSASLAAEALVTNASGSTATHEYRARVRSDILAELSRAARFKARFFRPRFIQLMLEGVARSAAIRGVMADLIAGTQSYRGLKWRLAETLKFGLAWDVLRAGKAVPLRTG